MMTNGSAGMADETNVQKSLADREDDLFDEWEGESGEQGFVRDGAVDAACYERSCRKTLFVLKEANDPNGGRWDLRKFLRDGGRGSTWNNIARWAEGIRRLPDVVPWGDLADMDAERRASSLRSIVAVNLKKEPGGATADVDVVRDFALANRAYLRRQFALYRPDYVVGCGSGVAEILFGDVYERRTDWASTSKGIWYAGFGASPDDPAQLVSDVLRLLASERPMAGQSCALRAGGRRGRSRGSGLTAIKS